MWNNLYITAEDLIIISLTTSWRQRTRALKKQVNFIQDNSCQVPVFCALSSKETLAALQQKSSPPCQPCQHISEPHQDAVGRLPPGKFARRSQVKWHIFRHSQMRSRVRASNSFITPVSQNHCKEVKMGWKEVKMGWISIAHCSMGQTVHWLMVLHLRLDSLELPHINTLSIKYREVPRDWNLKRGMSGKQRFLKCTSSWYVVHTQGARWVHGGLLICSPRRCHLGSLKILKDPRWWCPNLEIQSWISSNLLRAGHHLLGSCKISRDPTWQCPAELWSRVYRSATTQVSSGSTGGKDVDPSRSSCLPESTCVQDSHRDGTQPKTTDQEQISSCKYYTRSKLP